jgi:cholesterol transport system auxiliary component
MMAMIQARALKFGLILSAGLLAAACGGSAPETFDLSAASVQETHKLRAQIAIREPLTSLDLDSQRILVRTSPETVAYLTGAQWSDRLPTLIQTRLVQTFQNAHLLGSVGRAGAGFSSNYSLELDVRAFELDAKSVQANVDIAAKIVDDRGGRIVASRIFKMQVPSAGTGGAQASVALNAALSAVMTQIVAFTAASM